jgi:hypothetical protein
LGMIGGYGFKNGVDGFMGGDIFIGVDDAPIYGANSSVYTVGNNTVGNSFGYDYAIDLIFNDDATGGTYNVYKIDASTDVVTGYYSQNNESNPWQLDPDFVAANEGDPWATGSFSYAKKNNTATQAEIGLALSGRYHNIITGIDLSFIGNDKDFWAHYTMECGNDNLMGKGHTLPVPEPGSLILFGTGLLGLIGLSIGRRKK